MVKILFINYDWDNKEYERELEEFKSQRDVSAERKIPSCPILEKHECNFENKEAAMRFLNTKDVNDIFDDIQIIEDALV